MTHASARRSALLAGAALASLWLGGGLRAQQAIQARMGDPILGLTPAQRAAFFTGQTEFNHVLTNAEGLGPIFNDRACSHCHAQPQSGGSGIKKVTRFGKAAQGGNPFDPLANLGGSLLEDQTIDAVNCLEVVPPEATVQTFRLTPSIMGAGLVESIVDADILFYQNNPPSPDVHGVVQLVHPLENPALSVVGRYGWKAQQATVLSFSADASLNEMGLTNRYISTENAPQGNAAALPLCDFVPDPEDGAFPARIDRQTDFQRFLSQPPQTPRSGMTGASVFAAVGCTDCHVATPYVTKTVAEAALSNITVHPYSDYLLHDMGSLGDGIVQGTATETQIKTPALWGVRVRATVALLHNGSATGQTPEDNMRTAILAHDGEAATSRDAYAALSAPQQQSLLDFLDSLGRLEFDADGNDSVDATDWFLFQNAGGFTGPGDIFTPDSPNAIADFDQDGDFDLKDFGILQRAMTGS
jgi:CxxC motif-containing protein (DUF1111 family)